MTVSDEMVIGAGKARRLEREGKHALRDRARGERRLSPRKCLVSGDDFIGGQTACAAYLDALDKRIRGNGCCTRERLQ